MTDLNLKKPAVPNGGALALAACLALVAGCAVGPNFKRPEVTAPVAFKENAGWKVAAPDDGAKRGPWWEVFNDPVLNELENRVETVQRDDPPGRRQLRGGQADRALGQDKLPAHGRCDGQRGPLEVAVGDKHRQAAR